MNQPDLPPLIDTSMTSPDWQRLAKPWAVLPVGATEQHGPHLPLETDTLLATYFGRLVARELGAGLLPALAIATSYEHTGFRGSFSLKPETVAAIIRDLVEELASQHFTRLILLNAHGGNFILKPIARDINRQDGPLKIVLVNFYDFDFSPEGRELSRDGLHAGAWETSLMLAIHPEVVGDYQATESPVGLEGPVQSDLTHMGIGCMRPTGVWGDPRQATLENGQAIVASLGQNLVAGIRQRLDWLAAEPRYGGKGPVVLRGMIPEDFERGVELCRAAGWNQLRADWEWFYRCQADGCYVAQHNGCVVGTVTTIDYDQQSSWIGMVLVDPNRRRMGIGTTLLQGAIDSLADCRCVKLDATPAGKQLYDTLGFVDEYRLSRQTIGQLAELPPPKAGIRPLRNDDLEAVIALDAEAFGVPRPKVIEGLLAMGPDTAFVAIDDDGALAGFVLGRPGKHFYQVGPLTCGNLEQAQALASAAFSRLTGMAVVTDIQLHTDAWRDWLTRLGFSEQRPFIRMVKGENTPGRPELQYSISGPELG